MLLISHNLGVIEGIADRVGVMYAGKVVELGAAYDVLHRPGHDGTMRLPDAGPAFDTIGRRKRVAR